MEDVIETMLGVEIVGENDPATDMQQLAREKWERIRRKQQRALNYCSGNYSWLLFSSSAAY